MDDWIDATTAARRLGVKPATLYAYVSRGVLRRRHDPQTRRSLFDPEQVEELARRGRPRRPPAPTEIAIESRITVLGEDRPYYRGRDALELATSQRFEAVAEWLWNATPLDEPRAWQSRPEGVVAARAAQSGLPGDVVPLDRLSIIVSALAVTDPLRFHRDPAAVVAIGQSLIVGMVEALPELSPPVGGSVADLLWSRLCPEPPDPVMRHALEAALILLADHELAASTFAARVAASVAADPYAVVATGLGVVGGPMHGGAALGVERMLAEIAEPSQARRVIGDRLRRGERIPGAGHVVYRGADARCSCLLSLLPPHPVAEAVLAELRTRRLPSANIDFAVGTLSMLAGLVPGSGETIFAVGRTAGWLAHALEEYDRRAPLRPRAVPVRS